NTPRIVACVSCGSRFAEGIKFCGRCGHSRFRFVTAAVSGLESTGSSPPPAAQTIVACPRCKQQYPAGIRFCGKCGIPIGSPASLDWSQPRPVEVICKACGSSYSGGTKFCGRCGKPIGP